MKLEFSKIISCVVIALNIISYFTTVYASIFLSKDITKIHDYSHYLCVLVLSAYILKSGTENVFKINSNCNQVNKTIELGDINVGNNQV